MKKLRLSSYYKLSARLYLSRHAQCFAMFICLLSLVFSPLSLKSQTIPPPFINYQAVLYDVNNPTPNAVFSNQSFPTFVNISDELGNLLYREEHYASTDGNGLITVKMGDGLYVAGPITNFNQIDWGTGKYYLVVDFDINGTTSSTAPEQLVTVPYSFYSGKAGNGIVSVLDNGNGTLTFNYVNGTSYTTAPLTGLQGSSGSFPPGTNVGDMYFWNGTTWQIVPIGTQGQFLTVSNGIPSWQSITPNLNLPVVTALNCGAATFSGSIYQSSLLNGITVNVPYAGGNGVGYPAQTIQSVGITGLTATLVSGVLANGSGVLTYTLSGIAAASGSANFPLVFGGQNCVLSVPIQPTTNNAYSSATVFCASGPTAIVDVTNPSTGKTWMDRNLGASQVASSSTDAAAYGDLYQWGRGSDGHQCRTSTYSTVLSSTDQPGNSSFIYTPNALYDWRSPQNDNLWQGVNGTNNPCPTGYRIPTLSEWNAEIASWSSANSTGAFASPLKFTLAGWRESSLAGVATYGRYWSSTAATYLLAGNIFFDIADPASEDEWPRNYGLSVRCIKDASAIPATIGALNCGSTSITGTLTSGTAASSVSASVPYTGGNGGSYAAQTISSTGVTGLTATLATGVLANGSGSLSFAISGTPSASGTASFALTIGGQSCTLLVTVSTLTAQYPSGSIFCASGPTAIVNVMNPATGKIWMDRNLGASQAATSLTDVSAYGDLYQWGRRSDGHQCRTSSTTITLSSADQPAHGNFISALNFPNDWRNPQNMNLWQGVNGVNNPCPSGYRLPTDVELNSERLSWSSNNAVGAFNSILKFSVAGNKSVGGSFVSVGTGGLYWTSSISNEISYRLDISNSNASIAPSARALGNSVRCIKN
jgi:uncharacterized protein (TIGR02145 family)